MTVKIPEAYRDLLDGPVLVALGTVNPDGQPQVTPVWCSFDGEKIWINTVRGRRKEKNIRERPRVSVLAVDPQDPYRWLEVRGEADVGSEEGVEEHMDILTRLYTKQDRYYGGYAPSERRDQETRVIYRIRPTKVNTHR